MKRKLFLMIALLLTALLLTGCSSLTIGEMYALPKRSEEYDNLQSAIDSAMYGLTFSAPRSGENQQSVQMADLDGDGEEEYLVFAKGATEKPLQVLILRKEEDGSCRILDILGSSGTDFEQVEYADFDDKPGKELIIGHQVSDQVLRSVSVYTFTGGRSELLLMNGYSKFLTCDLDQDGRSELMVMRPGEAETRRGMAVLYSFENGRIGRSVETELSENTSNIRRIQTGRLQDGVPAVFVSSAREESAIVTDVFTLKNGKFTNVSFTGEVDTSIQTLRNFFIYADDIDGDGILEMPNLMTMKAITFWEEEEQKYLLRWSSMDTDGLEMDKMFTFHNYIGGWYLELDSAWASRVTVEPGENTFTFYLWDEAYEIASPLFTIYIFTGDTRDEDAVSDGRFVLYRAEGIAYAADLHYYAAEHNISEEYLIQSFRLIQQDWRRSEN